MRRSDPSKNALRSAAGALVFVMAALTAVGAGGAARAAEATSERTPFIAAADKICQAANDRLLAQVKQYETHDVAKARGARSKKTKVAKPEQVAAFLQKTGIREVTEELRQLRFLKPPAADEKLVDAMLTKAEAALAKVKSDPAKVAHDDPFAKVSKEFVAFGFAVCGHRIDRAIAP